MADPPVDLHTLLRWLVGRRVVAYTGYDLGHSGLLVTVADEYVVVAAVEPDDLERSDWPEPGRQRSERLHTVIPRRHLTSGGDMHRDCGAGS